MSPDDGALAKPPDYGRWPQALRPCDPGDNPYRLCPPMDLPKEFRCSNYGGGSCNHASFISVLRWQGLYSVAAWWRKTYAGGETADGLAAKADRKGLRFAYTLNGDAGFLEWCSRTRRGAAIHYYPGHAITFCGYDVAGNAVLLDNNNVDRYLRVPKAQFEANWRGYGGLAITVVYRPRPPRPWMPVKSIDGSTVEQQAAVGRRVIIRYPRPRPWWGPRPRPRPRPVPVPRPAPRPWFPHYPYYWS